MVYPVSISFFLSVQIYESPSGCHILLGTSVIYSLRAHFCLGPLRHLVVIPNKILVSPYKMTQVPQRGCKYGWMQR